MKKSIRSHKILLSPQYQSVPSELKFPSDISTRSATSINKKSIRQLLKDKTIKYQNKSQITLNLTYDDINNKKEDQLIEQFDNFLCFISRSNVNRQNSCQCYNKQRCKYIDRWLQVASKSKINKLRKLFNPDKKQIKQIDLDIQRTHNSFHNVQQIEFKIMLRRVLLSYCSLDAQINYIQGFNYLAASILIHSRSYQQTYQIFVLLMMQKKLRNIYLNDFELAKNHSNRIAEILKYKSNTLWQKLVQMEVQIELFILGWIIPLFSNIVSQEKMCLIIDNFINIGWNFVYAFCLTILLYFRLQIMELQYSQDIQMILSVQNILNTKIKWKQLVDSALNLPIFKNDIFRSKNQNQGL